VRESAIRNPQSAIEKLLKELLACECCSKMVGPVVTSRPVVSKIYLVGQAPGPHEGQLGRPFAWTAGKTLFRWFSSIGVDEEQFRSRVYMAAVCRCFPGKTKQGGDRVPSPEEIDACADWMKREIEILKPELIIPVGRLAIERFVPAAPLSEIIGSQRRVEVFGHRCDLIALPHPSGASTWFKREPGKSLLTQALALLAAHPRWQEIREQR
jgi:uracil-DNA glycosylase